MNVIIDPIDFVHLKITADKSTYYELSDYFSFYAENYRYDPRFRSRMWDGKIRLFSLKDRTLYRGLLHEVIKFCKEKGYTYENNVSSDQTPFSLYEGEQFIKSVNLPSKYEVRDYQIETLCDAIRFKQLTFESATSSGKSLMIYLITRKLNKKTLIIVPDVGLVHQMSSDFVEYGYKDPIHKIYAGQPREVNAEVCVSTWNSIWQLSDKWFSQFDIVFFDEAHKCKAKCLMSICKKLTQCEYRYGFTGTLGSVTTNRLVIQGLIGPQKNVITARELIDAGYASELLIRCIQLNYSNIDKMSCKNLSFHDEIKFLESHTSRNNFIKNLALSLKGNTLLLYHHIDHGNLLKDLIEKEASGIKIFYVDRFVKGDDRESIRKQIDIPEQNSLTFATFKIFSTGINIGNLNQAVICSPIKAEITLLQSIGRTLRSTETKKTAELIDISDNLSIKKHNNYTLNHYIERLKIYNKSQFPYKLYNVQFK